MGPGLVLLFWLFLGAIVFAVFSAFLLVAIYGHKNNRTILKYIGAIPASFIAILMIGFVVLVVYGIVSSMNPHSNFRTVFNEAPGDLVSEVDSKVFWFGDTGSIYLGFRTTEEEFLRLVPEGLNPLGVQAFKREMPRQTGKDIPEWWKMDVVVDDLCYLREHDDRSGPGKKGFYYETEYYVYDRSAGYAYYRFIGID